MCPDRKFLRMGDFKFELKGQRVVYDPIRQKTSFNPSLLPKHMLKGKRRYTPEVRRRMMKMKLHTRTTKKMWKKPTKAQLKKVTVTKNGKKIIKIVKGFKKVTKKV